jgi:hypothetical protein
VRKKEIERTANILEPEGHYKSYFTQRGVVDISEQDSK